MSMLVSTAVNQHNASITMLSAQMTYHLPFALRGACSSNSKTWVGGDGECSVGANMTMQNMSLSMPIVAILNQDTAFELLQRHISLSHYFHLTTCF